MKSMKKHFISVVMMSLISLAIISCESVPAVVGVADNPPLPVNSQPTVQKVELSPTGATINASSAAEVSALIASLVDDIKAKGVGAGKVYEIELPGEVIQSAGSNFSIDIPEIANSNINLVFDESFAAGTTLNISSSNTSSTPGAAVNKLTVTLPTATAANAIKLNVNMPQTTVTLKAGETNAVYEDVVASTALQTLVVDENVTVNNMEVQGGTVQVNEGGLLDTYVFAAEHNEDRVNITVDGGVEPIKVSGGKDEFGNPIELWQIASEDGNPYYAKSLKIIKGNADYALTWFALADPSTVPLKSVIIGDGAVLRTNWVAMENIIGEGSAKIQYRLTHVTAYTDDSNYGGDKFYEFNSDMSSVTNIKNITFSQPEIALDPIYADAHQQKIVEGYIQHEPRLNLGVDGTIEDCTFMYNHVFFCPESPSFNCPTVKGCKFVHVASDIIGDNNEVEMWIPYNPERSSNSIVFDGCEFSNNTKFMAYMTPTRGVTLPEPNTFDYTGIIDFRNCKLNGEAFTDVDASFFKRLAILSTGTKIIISFNGVPKYEFTGQMEEVEGVFYPILTPIVQS